MIDIKQIQVIDDSDVIKGYLIDIENKKVICKGTIHGYKQEQTRFEMYAEGFMAGIGKTGVNFLYDHKKAMLKEFNDFVEKHDINLGGGYDFS